MTTATAQNDGPAGEPDPDGTRGAPTGVAPPDDRTERAGALTQIVQLVPGAAAGLCALVGRCAS